jgi:large-conductance mechanosensitive channel
MENIGTSKKSIGIIFLRREFILNFGQFIKNRINFCLYCMAVWIIFPNFTPLINPN